MPVAVHLGHAVKRQQLVCIHGSHWDDTRDITAAITFLEFRKWREIKVQPDYGVALKSFNPCEGDWCWERESEAKGQSDLDRESCSGDVHRLSLVSAARYIVICTSLDIYTHCFVYHFIYSPITLSWFRFWEWPQISCSGHVADFS